MPLTQGLLTCGPQTLKVLVDKNAGAPRTSNGGNTSILLTCNGNEGFPSTVDIHNTPTLRSLAQRYTSLLTLPMLISTSGPWSLRVRAAQILVFTVPVNEYHTTASRFILIFWCYLDILGSLHSPICLILHAKEENLYSGRNSKPSPSCQVWTQEKKNTCSNETSCSPEH